MADVKDPIRQLIDVAVYAPIGLILLAHKELPNLVAAGKSRVESQVTLARFIGKLAVKRGGKELKRRLDTAEAKRSRSSAGRSGAIVDAESVDASITDDRSATSLDDALDDSFVDQDARALIGGRTLPAAIITAVSGAPEVRKGSHPQPGEALPIDGYDSLAASQVVVRLGTLTADELERIRRHEESHRARRTIIGKISQLQAR